MCLGGQDMSWQNEEPRCVFAYVRISAAYQNPERQLSLFSSLPDGHVFVDEISGAKRHRQKLDVLLDSVLREGDTLVVKSPDRLARNTRDLLDIAENLSSRGVNLEFVDTPELNISSAHGKLMLTIMAAYAEFERAMIRERQAEGIAIAKAAGKYQRKPQLTEEQVTEARQKIDMGVPKAQVARELGVSRTTLYNALDGKGIYAQPSAMN